MASYLNFVSKEKKLDGTHTFCVTGKADSPQFAKIERVVALLHAGGLTAIKAQFYPIHPNDWKSYSKQLETELGVETVPNPCVYTSTGRFLGDANEFLDLTYRKYGIKCDLNGTELMEIAKENLGIAKKLKERAGGDQNVKHQEVKFQS